MPAAYSALARLPPELKTKMKGENKMSPDFRLARWALFALAMSAGTAACSGDPGDADGGGGADGSGGSEEDGSGGSEEDGTGGAADGTGGTSDGTGGTSDGAGGNADGGMGGQGGEGSGGEGSGGEGTGGEGTGGSGPIFVQEKAFLLDNAINPYGTLIASDGKIYISGTTDTGGVDLGDTQVSDNLRLAVWRLNADGSLDGTWGTAGKLTADTIINPGTSYDIVQLRDGNFVVHFSGGPAGVSLVSLSSAGVFGTPSTVTFGWTTEERTEVADLCVAAAEAEEAVTDATDGGVCDDEDVTYDEVACDVLLDAAEATALECTTVWPAATAPAFAQRPTTLAQENSWGMALDSSGAEDKLVVAASSSAAKVATGTQRTDTDRYITRVLASDFSFDTTFNGGSVFTVNVSNLNLNDNTRRVIVEADGSILGSGYTNINDAFVGLGYGNHIALVRLLPNGTADPDFGFTSVPNTDFNPGQTLYLPFLGTGAMAEAYAAARTSTGAYVTTGYGTSNFNEPSISVDLVATAYNPGVNQDGLDPTFGGNTAGVVGGFAVQSEGDPNAGVSGTNPFMDRGRSVVALPDDRTVHGGVYDDLAAFFVLTPDGQLDETVGNGTGRIQYAFPFAFFGLTKSSDGSRVVGSSQSKARVNATTNTSGATVLGSYAKSLVAIIDIETM